MIDKQLFSSAGEEWETPQNLFDALNAIYSFELDACATPKNAKCQHYFTKADDALTQDWAMFGRVWMNPPYGRTIGRWMQKAYCESLKSGLVVALVPARTDTRWWHDWVVGRAEVTFLKGRLKFTRTEPTEAPAHAPFPSAIIIYAPRLDIALNGQMGARIIADRNDGSGIPSTRRRTKG